MAPELEKPRITEIQVRMDCNGCVQKIKKALHGINGICELYIDFPQQKITIIGWADPEKIAKAIKKTRKSAVICSHTEPPDPPEQPSQGEGGAQESKTPPSPEPANPSTEPASSEAPPPAESPNDPPPRPENPKAEEKSERDTAKASASQPNHPSRQKDVEEVHVIYHHPPDYGYRYPPPDYGYRYGYDHAMGQRYEGCWHSYPSYSGSIPESPPSQRYERQWHSYWNSAGSIPEPPSSQQYGGQWHSYPNSARTMPGQLSSQRYGGQWRPYDTDSRSTPEPPSHFQPSGLGPRVETPQPVHAAHSYNTGPRVETSQPVHVTHSYNTGPRVEIPQPVHVTHSYNTYRRAPYVTGYDYVREPPTQYANYNGFERYNIEDYHYGNTGNGNVTSIFSDENPNSCRIV